MIAATDAVALQSDTHAPVALRRFVGTFLVRHHEVAAGYFEREMARASVTPDPCPHPDGDVAGRAHLRFAFEMANWRQRYCTPFLLCDRIRPGRVVSRGADRHRRLERH